MALVALAVGFALEATGAGAAFGEWIALTMAWLSAPLLEALGTAVQRSGVELRSVEGGWAVRVSEVCDGTGLVVALGAALVALAPVLGGGRQIAGRLVAGFGLIQVFNLGRVLGLVLALDHAPAAFAPLHDIIFPALTVAALGLVLLPVRKAAMLAALSALAVALLGPAVNAASTLAAASANLFLPLGLPEVGTLALRADGWSIGTFFLAQAEPVALHVAPLVPSHFLTALPVLLAAAVLARSVLWLPAAVGLMLLALIIAAPVAVWTLAQARMPVTLLLPDGEGAYLAVAYAVPENLLAGLRLAQNAIVHFLLLVLPFLVVARVRA